MEREIKVMPNDNIDSIVYTLLAAKSRGEHAYCILNGHKLYSDTVSMDSAYREITGLTKEEHIQKMCGLQEMKRKEEIDFWSERGIPSANRHNK